jgi:hypothetical protein
VSSQSTLQPVGAQNNTSYNCRCGIVCKATSFQSATNCSTDRGFEVLGIFPFLELSLILRDASKLRQ